MIIVTKKQADIDEVLQEVQALLDGTNPAPIVSDAAPGVDPVAFASGVRAGMEWLLGGPVHPLHASKNEKPRGGE